MTIYKKEQAFSNGNNNLWYMQNKVQIQTEISLDFGDNLSSTFEM